MKFEKHEYDIVDEAINDGGIGIFITKAALEKWRDHYFKVNKEVIHNWQKAFYMGKRDVLTEILKHFEEE